MTPLFVVVGVVALLVAGGLVAMVRSLHRREVAERVDRTLLDEWDRRLVAEAPVAGRRGSPKM